MEQKKEKAISQTGCTKLLKGAMSITLGNGKSYQVKTEYFGLGLQKASQENQVVMLIKQHLPYDEVDTGWLVRTKEMDKNYQFGLKATKDARSWSVYNLNDVVAWGYADGGLNSDHFRSCQLRPDELQQPVEDDEEDEQEDFDTPDESEWGDAYRCRRCVKFKVDNDNVYFNAHMGVGEMKENGGTPLMHACAKAFTDFRNEHPEVTEMHFYTDEELAVSED
jgi:hypothetical protein